MSSIKQIGGLVPSLCRKMTRFKQSSMLTFSCDALIFMLLNSKRAHLNYGYLSFFLLLMKLWCLAPIPKFWENEKIDGGVYYEVLGLNYL